MTYGVSLPCQSLLNAGLTVLLPGDLLYTAREQSYWSIDAQLGPSCIVQPRSTEETASAVDIIVRTNGTFAVRSGGHTQWAGSNDVKDGVTVDMGLMTNYTYDPATTLAYIQPGGNWADVFNALAPFGVAVTGGRDGGVGIGGFLTGGGNSYYTGRMGLGCDSVVNFEIVLANGTIVQANKNSNPDLWKALKGGSGNFGVVTRFDMQAFSVPDLWGGMSTSLRSEGDKLITTLVNFTDTSEQNPDDAYIVLFNYSPGVSSDISIATMIINTKGVENSTAFSEVQKIPTLTQDISVRSVASIVSQYVTPGGTYHVWFTLTFNNNADIISKAASLHDEAIAELRELIPPESFSSQAIFQPMPAYFAQRGVAAGGNVLGMDKVTENSILWLVQSAYETAEQAAIAREKMSAMTDAIEEYAISVGGNVPWRYLNYANEAQNPLKSYGAENVEFMNKVAARYDPSGVFQKQMVSGWKLSKI